MKKFKFKNLVFFGLISVLFNSAGLHVFADDAQQKPVEQVQVEKGKTDGENEITEEEKLKQEEKNKKIKNYQDAILKSRQSSFKVENFKEEADKLYTAMVNFVAESDRQGVSAENFDDFVRQYLLNNSSGPMKCLDRAAFEAYVNSNPNSNIKRLYVGFKKKEDLENFRNGIPQFVGNIRGGFYKDFLNGYRGHCIYTYFKKGDVDNYVNIHDNMIDSLRKENPLINVPEPFVQGDFLELAVDGAIKIIRGDHLEDLIWALKFYHPEIGMAYELFDIGRSIYDLNQSMNFHYKCFRDVFKQVFGFDLIELYDTLKSDDYYKNLDDKSKQEYMRALNYVVHDKLIEHFPSFREKYSELLKSSTVKPHYTDKMFALLRDESFLAKLLGYDAVVEYCCDGFVDGEVNNKPFGYFIVNPGVITVCTDVVYNENNEPTLENIKKFFDKALEQTKRWN